MSSSRLVLLTAVVTLGAAAACRVDLSTEPDDECCLYQDVHYGGPSERLESKVSLAYSSTTLALVDGAVFASTSAVELSGATKPSSPGDGGVGEDAGLDAAPDASRDGGEDRGLIAVIDLGTTDRSTTHPLVDVHLVRCDEPYVRLVREGQTYACVGDHPGAARVETVTGRIKAVTGSTYAGSWHLVGTSELGSTIDLELQRVNQPVQSYKQCVLVGKC